MKITGSLVSKTIPGSDIINQNWFKVTNLNSW